MDENVELILEALKELKKQLKISNNCKYNSLEFVKAKTIKEIENLLRIFYSEESSLNFEDYHINYDLYFNDHQLFKTQLEADNLRMIIARYKNDFMDFCKFAWLQIEPIINFLIGTNYQYNNNLFENASNIVQQNIKSDYAKENFINKINQGDIQKIWGLQKLELCLVIISNNSSKIYQNIKNEERKKYLLLSSLYELRNIASHREKGMIIVDRIKEIKYYLFKNKASELYLKQDYQLIKKAIHWFICRCNQWIPKQARK
ncbi:hypothetical protein [Geminocystis herdmanii]|uniref:hypothetical protein n=1 Tax=Geminocystis herdmanii TaxID=669359 RepID=UPI00034D89FB|nr:hypothetical protein [Geminocystis herdmanii]